MNGFNFPYLLKLTSSSFSLGVPSTSFSINKYTHTQYLLGIFRDLFAAYFVCFAGVIIVDWSVDETGAVRMSMFFILLIFLLLILCFVLAWSEKLAVKRVTHLDDKRKSASLFFFLVFNSLRQRKGSDASDPYAFNFSNGKKTRIIEIAVPVLAQAWNKTKTFHTQIHIYR